MNWPYLIGNASTRKRRLDRADRQFDMARIFITWELGGGLGHVARLRALGAELIRRGHTVAVAANNVELCRQGFAGTGLEVRPAPSLPVSTRQLKFPCTYSDILHDCGYSSATELTAAVAGWLQLFDDFQPSLVICDHSPTALLASRVRDLPTATVGTGFTCPPDVSPLPSLRRDIREPHWAAEVERKVLDNMNASLAQFSIPALSRVAEIFGPPNRQYLLTFDVLDHYFDWRGGSGGTKYWPPVGMLPGQPCEWPTGGAISIEGNRVFVYLREQPTLLPILLGLAYKKIETVCFSPDMSGSDRRRFAGTSVAVSPAPVDLAPLCARCDAAVLNGGHGTVSTFLRCGVPMLLIPLLLEQQITADRIAVSGLGLNAASGDIDAIATALQDLLEDRSYLDNARQFARQHPVPEDAIAVAQLIDSLESEVR